MVKLDLEPSALKPVFFPVKVSAYLKTMLNTGFQSFSGVCARGYKSCVSSSAREKRLKYKLIIMTYWRSIVMKVFPITPVSLRVFSVIGIVIIPLILIMGLVAYSAMYTRF